MVPEEARALALKLANRRNADRLDPITALRLVELCDYLPLSIEVTANALDCSRSLDLEKYLTTLAEVTRPVAAMAKAKAVLRLSVAQLDTETRFLWRQLGVCVGNFDEDAAAAIWQLSTPWELLAELERRSLIILQSGRYRLHDLLRAVALEDLAVAPNQKLAAEARHASHYRNVLLSANKCYLEGGAGVLEGLQIYDLEQRQITAGQSWAMSRMDEDIAAKRLAADYADVVDFLPLRLPPRLRIVWGEAQAAACRSLGDYRREVFALDTIGYAYYDLGEPDRAIDFHKKALEIREKRGVRIGQGRTLGNLGKAYSALGNLSEGINYHERSIQAFDEEGDKRNISVALGLLGRDYALLGKAETAVELSRRGMLLARELGERKAECWAMNSLGMSYAALGDNGNAVKQFNQALMIASEIKDRWSEGQALGNLGLAYTALGETQQALEYYHQQLCVAQEIGDRSSEATALYHRAFVFEQVQEIKSAVASMERAIEILKSSKNPKAAKAKAKLEEWTPGELL